MSVRLSKYETFGFRSSSDEAIGVGDRGHRPLFGGRTAFGVVAAQSPDVVPNLVARVVLSGPWRRVAFVWDIHVFGGSPSRPSLTLEFRFFD